MDLPTHAPAPGRAGTLRVAVVGPTHPFKGGVAAHTTTLAHHLAGAGHDVTLVSWTHLYPSRLYPGEQSVPGGAPDVPPFPRTVRVLSWARPDTWVRTGRRLRGFDAIIVVHIIPAVLPALLTLLRSASAGRSTGRAGRGPRAILLAHNVLPHEPHPGDRSLVRAVLRQVDAVLVHSADQASLALDLGAVRVSVADLPAHLPGGPPVPRPAYRGPLRLLALGMVREYKGVDVLLRALAQVATVRLTIAGELWGSSGVAVRRLAADPRLTGRVGIESGYVAAADIARLLADHDVLTLTYRSATASQNALLGLSHGLPVLASDVGTFGAQVHDGVDGILVPPEDEQALVRALQRLSDPAQLRRLRDAVQAPDLDSAWAHYLGTLEALAYPGPLGVPAPPDLPGVDPVVRWVAAREAAGHLRRHAGELAGRAGRLRPTRAGRDRTGRERAVALGRGDLPAWVKASDVLDDAADAGAAQDLARSLRLPRAGDPVAAWAALGALATLIRLGDDGRRTALVVDESGQRSPLRRWVRAAGFVPLELEATGSRAAAALDVDPASLDVITRLHPGGCDVDDVDGTLTQASWALRPGGLVILTLPLGPAGADGAAVAADVRGVLARAQDRGFVLVGDPDGDIMARMREAREHATSADTAYGLVRLTFRRR